MGHGPIALSPPLPDDRVSVVCVASTWLFVGRDSRTAEQWSTWPPLGGDSFFDWPSGQPQMTVS